MDHRCVPVTHADAGNSCITPQSQNAVTTYFSSKNLLPFGFARVVVIHSGGFSRSMAEGWTLGEFLWLHCLSGPVSYLSWPDASRKHPSNHKMLTQCWYKVGPPSATLSQRWINIGSTSCICLVRVIISKTTPQNTICWNNVGLMLAWRRRRWANIWLKITHICLIWAQLFENLDV